VHSCQAEELDAFKQMTAFLEESSTPHEIANSAKIDLVAQASIQSGVLSNSARSLFEKMKKQAEEFARNIIAHAKLKAKSLEADRQKADTKSVSEWIVAENSDSDPAPKEINYGALGLSKSQDLDPELMGTAEKVVKIASSRHKSFVKQHKKDCQGPVCPRTE